MDKVTAGYIIAIPITGYDCYLYIAATGTAKNDDTHGAEADTADADASAAIRIWEDARGGGRGAGAENSQVPPCSSLSEPEN
jgi:hypothetical protein